MEILYVSGKSSDRLIMITVGMLKSMMKRNAMSVITKLFDIWKYVQQQND